MNIVLLLAGGVGSRMGADIPKQFIRIRNKPIIAYTIDILEKNKNIDAIEIVCVYGFEDLIKQIVDEYSFKKVKWICEGGPTFSMSVYNGLKNLRGKISPDDLLMIHMSVSPFINDEILDDAIRVAGEKGNSISENPCFLCMGTHDTNEYSTKSVLRETITGLNTPQTFRFGELIGIYEKAEAEGILNILEPHTTSIYYHYEKPLFFSKGSQLNIKITNQDDLDLFEAFCIMKEMREECQGSTNFATIQCNPLDFWHGHVPYNCAVSIIEVINGVGKLISDDKIYYNLDDAVDQYAKY